MRSPWVDTSGDRAAWESGLNRKRLKEVSRRRRKLEAKGTLSFSVERGEERLAPLLDEGFRVESSGWKDAEGTAILSSPATERFYREIAEWAEERGWLRLAFLRLDDRPIAFQLLLEHQRRLLYVKGGYDRELASFGPGQLMAQAVISDAFARGLESFEFLGSDESWKLDWTSTCRERLLLQAFAPSPAGLADWALHAYGRPLAKRSLALVGR
jgi:CelD/BcsL family acetyltransferase involved in cellulose biosynthesis